MYGKEKLWLVGCLGSENVSKPSQAKVLTGVGDLREAQFDVPLSVSHSCV